MRWLKGEEAIKDLISKITGINDPGMTIVSMAYVILSNGTKEKKNIDRNDVADIAREERGEATRGDGFRSANVKMLEAILNGEPTPDEFVDEYNNLIDRSKQNDKNTGSEYRKLWHDRKVSYVDEMNAFKDIINTLKSKSGSIKFDPKLRFKSEQEKQDLFDVLKQLNDRSRYGSRPAVNNGEKVIDEYDKYLTYLCGTYGKFNFKIMNNIGMFSQTVSLLRKIAQDIYLDALGDQSDDFIEVLDYLISIKNDNHDMYVRLRNIIKIADKNNGGNIENVLDSVMIATMLKDCESNEKMYEKMYWFAGAFTMGCSFSVMSSYISQFISAMLVPTSAPGNLLDMHKKYGEYALNQLTDHGMSPVWDSEQLGWAMKTTAMVMGVVSATSVQGEKEFEKVISTKNMDKMVEAIGELCAKFGEDGAFDRIRSFLGEKE